VFVFACSQESSAGYFDPIRCSKPVVGLPLAHTKVLRMYAEAQDAAFAQRTAKFISLCEQVVRFALVMDRVEISALAKDLGIFDAVLPDVVQCWADWLGRHRSAATKNTYCVNFYHHWNDMVMWFQYRLRPDADGRFPWVKEYRRTASGWTPVYHTHGERDRACSRYFDYSHADIVIQARTAMLEEQRDSTPRFTPRYNRGELVYVGTVLLLPWLPCLFRSNALPHESSTLLLFSIHVAGFPSRHKLADRSPMEIDIIGRHAMAQLVGLENKLKAYFCSEFARYSGGAFGLPHRTLSGEQNPVKEPGLISRDECGLTHDEWNQYKECMSVVLAAEMAGQRAQIMCKFFLSHSALFLPRSHSFIFAEDTRRMTTPPHYCA